MRRVAVEMQVHRNNAIRCSGDEVVLEAGQLTATSGVPDQNPFARRRRPRRDTAEEPQSPSTPTPKTET